MSTLVTASGSVVDLTSVAEVVAAYDDLRELKSTVDGQQVKLAEAFADLNGPLGRTAKIDGAALRENLAGLVDDHVIDEVARPKPVEYQPMKRELSKLRGLDDPTITAAIDAATSYEPQARRLTIKAIAKAEATA